MTPHTVRLDPELDREIKNFCREEGLEWATVVRGLIKLGWGAVKDAAHE